MSVSGWYPDPAGAPGRFRYWDGNRWSNETTDNPNSAPPCSGQTSYDSQQRPGRGRVGWIIGALALLLVIVVVGVSVVRAIDDRGRELADPDPPATTVSGWDDSSPLPTASPTPTPSPSPTASKSAAPNAPVACATGDPFQTEPQPGDGRIHGGGLSFQSPGWPEDASYAQQMTWAYDVDGVEEETEPGWAALMAVGGLRADDGFHTPRQSADGMMQCIASSAYYSGFTGRKDVFSKPVTVDGRSGWALRSQIYVDNPGLSVPGDVAEVVVINSGTAGRLSFFAGFVPIGDHARGELLDQAIASLQVD